MNTKRSRLSVLAAVWGVVAAGSSAIAAYVTPKIGGGQIAAEMKHLDILFDGTNITVHLDESVPTPELRPLIPPDEFDPTKPWSVLIDKAYNYQYAFNPGGFITLPPGGAIWVERLHHDPGLQTYLRPPQWSPDLGPTWTEIFTADGDRWKWEGAMQHNAYAVRDPTQSVYTADYRIYIGHETTGEPLPGYGSAEATWIWNVTLVTLTLTTSNGRYGSVEFNPVRSDLNNLKFCQGSVVTLTAIPEEGRSFREWTIYDPNYPGDANHAIVDANLSTTMVMLTDRHVQATFNCSSGLGPMLPLMATGLAGMVMLRRRNGS
jgi:hypothetical protein